MADFIMTGENMNSYCAPLTMPFSGMIMSNASTPEAAVQSIDDDTTRKHKPQVPMNAREYEAMKAFTKTQGVEFAPFVRAFLKRQISGDDVILSSVLSIPPVDLVGTIHAGEGDECREDVRGQIFCSEHPSGDSYAYLEIEGDCMDKVVPPGARALFRRQGFRHNQIVAVRFTWPDGCDFCLRRLKFNDKHELEFHPESNNPKNKPLVLTEDKNREGFITLNPDNAEIVGVFTGDYIVRGRK